MEEQRWKRKNEIAKEYRQRPDCIDIVHERNNTKIICDCCGIFTANNKAKHERTNKHIKYVVEEQQKQEQECKKDLEKWESIKPLF